MGKENNTRVLCQNCVLPSTFPGISFNEEQICNHCQRYKGKTKVTVRQKKYEQKFLDLLMEHRRKEGYDVLVAYSGGKDSTYTLDVFVNKYKLRVLAITLDNTFISPAALDNIGKVCGNLGVDSLLVRPNIQLQRKIYAEAAHREIFSRKSLERASTICTSCISFVKGITMRTALEKNIPFIGYGWSPGQAPVSSSVMKTNPKLMKEAQQVVLKPLLGIAGDEILPHFVPEDQFVGDKVFPYHVHPLAFLEYDEGKIIDRIKRYGWVKPDDTDLNSSNCKLNAFANQIHRQRYDFHPYAWEVANMVRSGVLSRDEGLAKIEPPEDEGMVKYARDILLAD